MAHGLRKSLSRCGIDAALFLLLFLSSGSVASASGHTVNYGFDDPDNSEAGKLDCKYEQDCVLNLKNGNIRLWLDFSDPKHKVVNVTILRTNWGPGCCYFDGGVSQMRLDPRSRVALGVSFGRARRGLEYVESNIRFGMLYLLFSDKN